ncbi:MAG: hypothetical protein IH840_02795 [Candidatus Heimdallarchaeota archaeon]|nr:hypothetical protein [Candidatus Heimdallarchaeota archaeon]
MKELYETGVELSEITALDIFDDLARMKYETEIKNLEKLADTINNLSDDQFNVIGV